MTETGKDKQPAKRTHKQTAKDKPAAATKTKAKAKTATTKKKPAQKATVAKETTQRKRTPSKRPGRPDAWEDLEMSKRLTSITGWAKQGATVKELCEMIGISDSTFYKWQAEKPEFKDAVRAGRHFANGELLAAAFRQSTGFTVPRKTAVRYKTYEEFKDPKTGENVLKPVEKVTIVEDEMYIEPNAQLIQFMLANRMPEHYKRQHHLQHSGSIGGSMFGHLSDEELDAELAKLEGEEDGGKLH